MINDRYRENGYTYEKGKEVVKWSHIVSRAWAEVVIVFRMRLALVPLLGELTVIIELVLTEQ